MFIIINYTLCIIYIIKINAVKFVIILFNKITDSIFSNKLFNKFLNKIYNHFTYWKHFSN